MTKPPASAALNPVRYAPIKFFLIYLVITFGIAVWGPIDYYQFPVYRTAAYMGLIGLTLFAGFTIGINSQLPLAQSKTIGGWPQISRLFTLSLAIAWVALLYSVYSALSNGQLNTDISALGDAYVDSYTDYERNSGTYSMVFILYSASLPFNFIASILGLYYFSRFSLAKRLLLVALIVCSLLFYLIGSGKQKQIGDVLIYLISIAAIRYGVRGQRIQFRGILITGLTTVFAVLTFLWVLTQRYAALGVTSYNVNDRSIFQIRYDFGHPIFQIFGADYGLVIAQFLSYISQGYYGLGLALKTDWHWTYFLGSSYSVSIIASRGLGLNWVWPDTLLMQVAKTTGWGESKWHSAFTYFATDFTWPGTIVLFGFFAYIYARAWLAAIRFQNPFAILMFSLLTLGAFYMPANNQLLHSPGALFSTSLISFMYLRYGRAYNYAPDQARLFR